MTGKTVMKANITTLAAGMALAITLAGGAMAQLREAANETSRDVGVLKSEVNRLQEIIRSLDRRINKLNDALADVEERLEDAQADGRLAPAKSPPAAANCGKHKHGSVFTGKPVECYYGYRIYQCMNGKISVVGGECEAAKN